MRVSVLIASAVISAEAVSIIIIEIVSLLLNECDRPFFDDLYHIEQLHSYVGRSNRYSVIIGLKYGAEQKSTLDSCYHTTQTTNLYWQRFAVCVV